MRIKTPAQYREWQRKNQNHKPRVRRSDYMGARPITDGIPADHEARSLNIRTVFEEKKRVRDESPTPEA